MRKLRFDEHQIVAILRESERGNTIQEVCRKAGIARQTSYRWRLKYGGLALLEIKRLRYLEDENVLLRKLVAYLSLDHDLLRDVLSAGSARPLGRRDDLSYRRG